MADINEIIVPREVNTDLSSLYLGNDKARFIRGIDYALYGGKGGENQLVLKPEESNKLYDTDFRPPAGDNFAIGRKVSVKTNEVYVLAYNSKNNHFIYRIKNGKCEYVCRMTELDFVLDPKYFIREGRIVVIPFCKGDVQKTYLIWTDHNDDQHFLCVEDSIATDSYNPTTFPYFTTSYPRREYITLGLRAPTDCIGVIEVPNNGKGINKLKNKSWKFRVSGYDVYGRPLEHGIISNPYYISDCANDTSQCLDLTFDILSPLVDKLLIEFSNDCGITWKRHAIVNKYEECTGEYWQRQFNKTLSITNNKLTYRFCPGEQCLSIAPAQTNRSYNPLPNKSNGVVEIAGGIALYNNEYGHKPFSCDVMDRIKFEVENPSPSQASNNTIANRTIRVLMAIWNPYIDTQQAIWRKDDAINVFGGLGLDGRIEDRVAGSYKQNFADSDAEGFIGYLSDGSVAVSKQYRFTGDLIAATPANAGNQSDPNEWVFSGVEVDKEMVRGNIHLQYFEFKNMKPGKYIFRVAGHESSLNDNYKRTSTYFVGTKPFWGHRPNFNATLNPSRELVIDICGKDYDGFKDNEIIQLYDLTIPQKNINLVRASRVSCGYAYETSDSGNGVNPISLATVLMDLSGDPDAIWTYHTDYNGFWFTAAKDKTHEASVYFFHKCKLEKVPMVHWSASEHSGLKKAVFFATSKWPNFLKDGCNRILLKGKVLNCTTQKGIPNVSVALTDGQSAVTDNNGEYEIITYDWERVRNEPQSQRNDLLLFLASGKCKLLNCDGSVCIPSLPIGRPTCVDCNDRIFTAPITNLKFNIQNDRGLQLGGRYPFGLGGADWMDRKGFVQTKKEFTLDIPTANEIGFLGAYPKVKWSIPSDVTFDPWVERVYFYWGKNLKYSDFLSWVVDRVKFIDNTGNENTVAPTQIRIYYSSLNEYNKQNNFSTNSVWDVIDDKDSIIRNDNVHFIANGDGTLFPTVITELVRLDKDGQYFQIDYNSDLKDLKEGALLKFIREADCTQTDLFYDICETVNVINGKPERNFGYLNIFDSYMVDRQIPTPIITTKKIKEAIQGITPPTYVEKEITTTTNTIKNYGWSFEHHSPSDLWGNKCTSHGRPAVKNDLEDVECRPTEFAMSGVLGDNGLVNYLHYFDNNRLKPFEREYTWITCAIVRGNLVLVICQNKNFLTAYDDTTARMGANNTVQVLSGEKQFSIPQNIGLAGCREQDRNVIATDGDMVGWVDGTESELIVHNFSQSKKIAKDKFESFLRRKIKAIDRNNSANGKTLAYLHGEINPKDGRYYITDFKIGSAVFVNDTSFPQTETSETLCVDLASEALVRFCHFTPEMYACQSGEENDKQFFSFQNAMPYAHHNNGTDYLNYYGIQCTPKMRIAMSTNPTQYKNFLSTTQHSDRVVLYGKEVLVYGGQRSVIPRNFFKRANKCYVAPFLCDMDSNIGIDPLIDGEKLRGKYIEILFVGDPDKANKYFELTAIEIKAIING